MCLLFNVICFSLCICRSRAQPLKILVTVALAMMPLVACVRTTQDDDTHQHQQIVTTRPKGVDVDVSSAGVLVDVPFGPHVNVNINPCEGTVQVGGINIRWPHLCGK